VGTPIKLRARCSHSKQQLDKARQLDTRVHNCDIAHRPTGFCPHGMSPTKRRCWHHRTPAVFLCWPFARWMCHSV